MNNTLSTALIGVATGAVGYWVTTFWMRPILRYHEIRSQILIDLVFYAQVINADGLNDKMKALYNDRIESNRLRSAELTACTFELPCWYKCWLCLTGSSPEKAASNLIGFSNTTDFDSADKRIELIKKALNITTEII